MRRAIVDDVSMESTLHIYQHTCNKCDRPALTFDKQGQPLCGRHATIFVGVQRADDKDDGSTTPDVNTPS